MKSAVHSAAVLLAGVAVAASMSVPPATAQTGIVLGAPMGEYSKGYGDPRPAMITQASMCGDVVHDITWESWGGPVARGTGTQCQSAGETSRGEPVQYRTLTASDPGPCKGGLAYRKLQFDSGDPIDICR